MESIAPASGRVGVLVCLLAVACGDSSQPSAADLYTPAVSQIVVEVAYVPGAEPATGPLEPVGETWGILAANLDRLFRGGAKAITVPRSLGEMASITDAAQDDYDLVDLVTIAAAHRRQPSGGGTATFFVVFLAGYYRTELGRQPAVLGAAVHGAGIIGLFQPALRAVAIDPSRRGFVEQLTVVHEMGHAAGLVNDGIPMATPHEDPDHPLHCANADCVMYYANEGAAAVEALIERFLVVPTEILFGAECLADADAAGHAAAALPGR